MTESSGRCPHCESQGAIGAPCGAPICKKRGYYCIPEEDFLLLDVDAEEPIDPRIGTKMDEYLITGFLGRGGFGRVYMVRQLPILLKAALKVLNFDAIPESGREKITEKFEIEAKALASLSHPNVVRLLKYGISRERPYLVMELVKGGRNLKNAVYDRIAQGHKVSKKAVFHVLHQVVNALDAAHRNPSEPIVHRDIKPENIMLHAVPENPNLVKVLDFGLAKFVAGSTETTSIMGTPIYMAPEQLTRSDIGPWTDFYSLGVITFELLNGRCPFVGDTHSEVIAYKVDPDFDPVRILDQPNLSEEIKAFYRKALARRPNDRFQNAKAFRSGLRKLEALMMAAEGTEVEDAPLQAPLFESSARANKSSNQVDLDDTLAEDPIWPRVSGASPSVPMGTPSFMAKDEERMGRTWIYGIVGALAAILVIALMLGRKDEAKPTLPTPKQTSSVQGTSENNNWSGLAGSPIWKTGNKWNLRVVRVASLERIDEGAPLEFLIRREIVRVEKDDDGDLRVEVRQTGGLLKPHTRVFHVDEHCITELNNSSRKWCVEDLTNDLKTVDVLGRKTEVFSDQADSFSLQFSPEMGWIREDQVQGGTGRKTTRRLKGVVLNGEDFGKPNQIPLPCSWDRSLALGELMGHADAEGTPEARKALEAGLEGPVYAYNIKLSGQYGFEELRALRDENSTVFELVGTHEAELLKPDLLKFRLHQVKAWVNTQEPAEYVMIKLKGDRYSAVVVIRMAVDGVAAEIFRVSHARAHHSIALVAYGKACQFQIQRVKSGSRTVQRYTFGGDGLEKVSGSLKVRRRLLKLPSHEAVE